MNKRQAKKQYKKIHGHNPPKTAVAVYTPEEIESMKMHNNLTPEDIERIDEQSEKCSRRNVQSTPKSCGEHGQSV